jgi:hypothetical protein
MGFGLKSKHKWEERATKGSVISFLNHQQVITNEPLWTSPYPWRTWDMAADHRSALMIKKQEPEVP